MRGKERGGGTNISLEEYFFVLYKFSLWLNRIERKVYYIRNKYKNRS